MKKLVEKCFHQTIDSLKISPNFSLCFHCSTAIIKIESKYEISSIKPKKYSVIQENSTPLIISINDTHKTYSFLNKIDYIKIRLIFIKQMKIIYNNFNLNKKTLFLSIDYFDRICSKMKAFDLEALKQICLFCIILASKFQENGQKWIEIKKALGIDSYIYSKDELFLLQILDYNLHIFTPYDILIDMLYCGFIFSHENFSEKKMNIIYENIENILYLFSESRYYIDMTYKEIALSIIGLIREILGLESYNDIIKNIFMNDCNEAEIYLLCLNKLKKCFKFNNKDNKDNNQQKRSNNKNIISEKEYKQ